MEIVVYSPNIAFSRARAAKMRLFTVPSGKPSPSDNLFVFVAIDIELERCIQFAGKGGCKTLPFLEIEKGVEVGAPDTELMS